MSACSAVDEPRARPRWGLRLATATSAVILATVVIPTPPLGAQENPTDPAVSALARAIERRLTVWRTESRVVYVQHCRSAREGCASRVATFARLIGDASRRHDLDPFLLAAMAFRESGMNPLAAGAAGERGIVQLHPRGPGAGVRFVRSEAYRRNCERRPGVCQEEVLDAGAQLLSRSLERCGTVRDALGAYNRGLCGATDYSRRVMTERQHLLRLAKADAASLASVN